MMRDPWDDAAHAHLFATHERTALPRAPLNSALSGVIARDRSLASLVGHAPPSLQQPVLLLAALHLLVLDDPTSSLASWYPTVTEHARSPTDPALEREVRAFVADRLPEVISIVASRRVQTNEIGRCALLLPVMAAIAAETDRSLGHVDVGTSAGLTLLLPDFAYEYEHDGVRHDVGRGSVGVRCGLRGDLPVPLPHQPPSITTAIGLDQEPIDVTDDRAARWLLACCWPDETARASRLRSAIELARTDPPTVVSADASEVDQLVTDLSPEEHPVITTTWVLNYLDPSDRASFVGILDELGSERDLDWIFAESPAQTPDLPHPPALAGEHVTALVRVTWRDGRRTVDHIGRCHPHGHWLHALTGPSID